MCSSEQMAYLVRVARGALVSSFGYAMEDSGLDPGGWPTGFVNITLRRNGQLAGSMGANGTILPEAVKAATRRAALDSRFHRTLLAADLPLACIEVWIQMDTELLEGDAETICRKIHMGRDGVRILHGDKTAYYKPSVPITHSVTSQQQLLSNLCRKAELPESAWTDPEAQIERSAWMHAIESPGTSSGFVILNGMRSDLGRRAEPEQLRSAASLCAAHLLAIQKCDGSFGYIYNPFKDEWAPKEHRLRLAGCTYALTRAAASPILREQPRLAHGASRALEFMMTHTEVAPFENGRFVYEAKSNPKWGKLGTTALTLVAHEYTNGEVWRERAAQLLNTLTAVQNPDGSFTCSICRNEAGENDQNFFPGECLLALALNARRTQNEEVSRVIGRSFRYYRDHFYNRPATAFVLWQSDAWTNVAEGLLAKLFPSLGPDGPQIDDIFSFVFLQVDWLLQFQYTEGSGGPAEYLGGFKVPRSPTISSAAFGEAIIRGCKLAALAGDLERVKAYRKAALLSLEFMMRLQLLPGIEAFFPRPTLAIGGMTESFESFEIRCDYDQHFLTACIAALETPALWE
jgi:AMMECR1 domain-containing protein